MKNLVLSIFTITSLATGYLATGSISCDPANCPIELCKDGQTYPPGCCDLSAVSAKAVQTSVIETVEAVADTKCCSKATACSSAK